MNVAIEGIDEILKLLEELPKRVERKVTKKALRRAGNVVRDGMRAEVDTIPYLSASGKKRLKLATKPVFPKGSRGKKEVAVGAVYKGQKNIAPDAHWYELGTDERFTKSGASRGRIEMSPFMRPGYEKTKEKALVEMAKAFTEEIEAEAVRLAK
jgi:HK97 gp10 family phage protein